MKHSKYLALLVVALVLAGVVAFSFLPQSDTYESLASSATSDEANTVEEPAEEEFVVTHIETPEPVKALYMTSWVAGVDRRHELVDLIKSTEANAIIIDIKDDTGQISFLVDDPLLDEIGAESERISDIKEFIGYLHDLDIYVIGRISVFQDPWFTKVRPDLAVKRASDGEVWQDRKGISWLDAGAEEVWRYVVALARESYDVGFDEINFDYVRFPSDGNMQDIAYEHYDSTSLSKEQQIEEFFSYLHTQMRRSGIPHSADLFGYTATANYDLNIGQILERALPYFDYIAPMVYPSHFNYNFKGLGDPNDVPGEVVYHSMLRAVERAEAIGEDPLKLRPWLQDFDYGGVYDAADVRAQIDATYNAGLTSWMLWDPANRYTRGALQDSN